MGDKIPNPSYHLFHDRHWHTSGWDRQRCLDRAIHCYHWNVSQIHPIHPPEVDRKARLFQLPQQYQGWVVQHSTQYHQLPVNHHLFFSRVLHHPILLPRLWYHLTSRTILLYRDFGNKTLPGRDARLTDSGQPQSGLNYKTNQDWLQHLKYLPEVLLVSSGPGDKKGRTDCCCNQNGIGI